MHRRWKTTQWMQASGTFPVTVSPAAVDQVLQARWTVEAQHDVCIQDCHCSRRHDIGYGGSTGLPQRGSSEENEFHICVRVCGVEGRSKSLSGQFFFVCEKGDLEESSTKSLGGMTRPKDEIGSQNSVKLSLPSPTFLI